MTDMRLRATEVEGGASTTEEDSMISISHSSTTQCYTLRDPKEDSARGLAVRTFTDITSRKEQGQYTREAPIQIQSSSRLWAIDLHILDLRDHSYPEHQ